MPPAFPTSALLLGLAIAAVPVLAAPHDPATASIAVDPVVGEVGVTVASRVLAVGPVVRWARAGAGPSPTGHLGCGQRPHWGSAALTAGARGLG